MAGILIILGIIIIIAAFAVAFDDAPLRRKAIGCILGGAVLGTFFLTPIGALGGLIAPGTSNPAWKDMLFAGLLCGVAGGGMGMFSGTMTLGLSVLIRGIFAEQLNKRQPL